MPDMKLLLTSGGVTNASIHSALTRLLGKPIGEAMFEVMGVGMWLQYYADLEVEREILDNPLEDREILSRPGWPPMAFIEHSFGLTPAGADR